MHTPAPLVENSLRDTAWAKVLAQYRTASDLATKRDLSPLLDNAKQAKPDIVPLPHHGSRYIRTRGRNGGRWVRIDEERAGRAAQTSTVVIAVFYLIGEA